MSNTLGNYNPIMYAQEALIQLEKALGMARRVHLGYDEERRSFRKGSLVSITRPGTFTVKDAPNTSQDLLPETVNISLDYWREVKFELTDKELAFTTEKIIEDHIRPAAYKLADDIDQKLTALYTDVPWYVNTSADPATVADMVAVRTQMFNNAVPLDDPSRVHLMLDGTLEGEYLGNSAFSQQQGAGDQGVATQMRGHLGTKFGMEVFANQNVKTHTAGTETDVAQDVDGALAVGATTMNTTLAGVGTLVPGDTFVFANHSQRYAVTNTTTAATNAHTGVTFTPPLTTAVPDATVVTFVQHGSVANALGFHRNAFGLVTAPLSDLGGELGAKVISVQDPITGLSLRHRMFYDGNNSKVIVALDVLYGVKTLDPNLAVRFIDIQ